MRIFPNSGMSAVTGDIEAAASVSLDQQNIGHASVVERLGVNPRVRLYRGPQNETVATGVIGGTRAETLRMVIDRADGGFGIEGTCSGSAASADASLTRDVAAGEAVTASLSFYLPDWLASAPAPTPVPTPTPTPPPPPPAGSTVPDAILAMPSAPMPTSSQYTTKTSTTENWQGEEWGSWLRRAGTRLHAEANTWDVGPDRYDLAHVSDPNATLSGNQFHLRVGAGAAVGNSMSIHMVAKLPGHAALQAYRKPGADSEVVAFPSWGAGQMINLGHRQSAVIPNVPIQLKDVRSLWIGAKSWTLSGSHGPGWIAHDMRILNRSRQWSNSTWDPVMEDLDAEFMVTHRHFPADHNISDTAGSGTHCGIHTIAGIRFRLWCMLGASRWSNGQRLPLIQFRAIDGAPGYVPLHAIIAWGLSTTYRSLGVTNAAHRVRGRGLDDTVFSRDHWWHQVMTGIEVEYGNYDLKVDTYTVRVNED